MVVGRRCQIMFGDGDEGLENMRRKTEVWDEWKVIKLRSVVRLMKIFFHEEHEWKRRSLVLHLRDRHEGRCVTVMIMREDWDGCEGSMFK